MLGILGVLMAWGLWSLTELLIRKSRRLSNQ
jgi:hypothetical protein